MFHLCLNKINSLPLSLSSSSLLQAVRCELQLLVLLQHVGGQSSAAVADEGLHRSQREGRRRADVQGNTHSCRPAAGSSSEFLPARATMMMWHWWPVISISVLQKQLMESLRKKLGVLREAQRGLQDDIRANAQLGEEVRTDFSASIAHSVTQQLLLVPTYLLKLAPRSLAGPLGQFGVFFRLQLTNVSHF